jgi:hypothetical protein
VKEFADFHGREHTPLKRRNTANRERPAELGGPGASVQPLSNHGKKVQARCLGEAHGTAAITAAHRSRPLFCGSALRSIGCARDVALALAADILLAVRTSITQPQLFSRLAQAQRVLIAGAESLMNRIHDALS